MSAVTFDTGGRDGVRDGADERPGLGRLTRVELRKMTDTRAGFWLQATTALLTVAAVVILLLAGRGEDHAFRSMLGVATMPAAILLPVIGILLVTSEWTQRTTLITFALVPQRSRVLVAKLLAGSLLALVVQAICVVLAVVGTALAAPGLDDTWSHAAPLVGQSVVMLVTSMIIGVAFGAALTTSAPAIVLYFALPMVFGIVGSFAALEPIAEWLDTTRTMGAVTEELMGGEEWARAFVSLLLWMVLPLASGWWRVTRGEVR